MIPLLAKALSIAVIVQGPCPEAPTRAACAAPPQTIYLSSFAVRADLHHELGHVIDYNFLTDRDRVVFGRLTRDERPWRSPPDSPHERFAEAVRHCARSSRYPDSRTAGTYGYDPSLRTHRRVCRWLSRSSAATT